MSNAAANALSASGAEEICVTILQDNGRGRFTRYAFVPSREALTATARLLARKGVVRLSMGEWNYKSERWT